MLGDVVVQDFGSRAREAVPSLFGPFLLQCSGSVGEGAIGPVTPFVRHSLQLQFLTCPWPKPCQSTLHGKTL